MGSLFRDIDEKNLLPDLPCILDWLLDDKRFQGARWDKKAKTTFTKKIRKLDGMGAETFNRKSKALNYPKFATKRNRKKRPFAVISTSGSLGVDLVRHIRNGIAHGNAELYMVNKTEYIEIRDYGRKGQTAYIAIPIHYLHAIHSIYQTIEEEHVVKSGCSFK